MLHLLFLLNFGKFALSWLYCQQYIFCIRESAFCEGALHFFLSGLTFCVSLHPALVLDLFI